MNNLCFSLETQVKTIVSVFQPDRVTAKQLLHAGGVNKKNARKKKKLEKALAVLKVSIRRPHKTKINITPQSLLNDFQTIKLCE